VATIPDAGGARYARCGVVRVFVRFAVLSGLVIAGWLLGSGVGHATEDQVQPGTGAVRLADDPGDITGPSDGRSHTQFGLPPTVASTVQSALSRSSVPRLSVQRVLQPVVILKPVVRAVVVPRPLTHVLATASRPMSAPVQHSAGIWSQKPVHELAPVAPAVRAPAVTAALPAPAVATAPATAGHTVSHGPVCAAAPAEHPLAHEITLGGGPPGPMPTSPPDSTTAPCMIGNAAGGGGTKGSPDLAVNENETHAGLASTPRLGYLNGSDLPRSLAEQPSTSPD
jgi:hypothetical protein